MLLLLGGMVLDGHVVCVYVHVCMCVSMYTLHKLLFVLLAHLFDSLNKTITERAHDKESG